MTDCSRVKNLHKQKQRHKQSPGKALAWSLVVAVVHTYTHTHTHTQTMQHHSAPLHTAPGSTVANILRLKRHISRPLSLCDDIHRYKPFRTCLETRLSQETVDIVASRDDGVLVMTTEAAVLAGNRTDPVS